MNFYLYNHVAMEQANNTGHLKEIHIGQYVAGRVRELNMSMERITGFFKIEEKDILEMFRAESFDCYLLLRWSKLLEYDFFRLYSQHLILYSPPASMSYNSVQEKKKSSLPEFRKNIYTKEVINYIMELIETNEKTKREVMKEYRIPKTTLYKWIRKYKIKE